MTMKHEKINSIGKRILSCLFLISSTAPLNVYGAAADVAPPAAGPALPSIAPVQAAQQAATTAAASLPNHALPSPGHVVHGTVQETRREGSVVYNQTSATAIMEHMHYNIGADAHAHYQQPSGGVMLARVTGDQFSQINGKLTATDTLFLVNENGIYFGSDAQIEAGNFIASTRNITNADFLAGNYDFIYRETGQGPILVAQGAQIKTRGFSALLSPLIGNFGLVTGKMAYVGNSLKFSFDANNLVNFEVPKSTFHKTPQVGEDGRAVLRMDDVEKIIKGVVYVGESGQVEANGVRTDEDGVIHIEAQNVIIDGTVKVDNKDKEQGQGIKVLGDNILVTEKGSLDTGRREDNTIPQKGAYVLVGGDFRGQGTTRRAKTLTFHGAAYGDAIEGLPEEMDEETNPHRLVLWSDEHTHFNGNLFGRTKRGRGAKAEASGKIHRSGAGMAYLTSGNGPAGTMHWDPGMVEIIDGGPLHPGADMDVFSTQYITNQLGAANLEISTDDSNVGPDGYMIIDGSFTVPAGRTLTLKAKTYTISGGTITLDGNLIYESLDPSPETWTAAQGSRVIGHGHLTFNFGSHHQTVPAFYDAFPAFYGTVTSSFLGGPEEQFLGSIQLIENYALINAEALTAQVQTIAESIMSSTTLFAAEPVILPEPTPSAFSFPVFSFMKPTITFEAVPEPPMIAAQEGLLSMWAPKETSKMIIPEVKNMTRNTSISQAEAPPPMVAESLNEAPSESPPALAHQVEETRPAPEKPAPEVSLEEAPMPTRRKTESTPAKGDPLEESPAGEIVLEENTEQPTKNAQSTKEPSPGTPSTEEEEEEEAKPTQKKGGKTPPSEVSAFRTGMLGESTLFGEEGLIDSEPEAVNVQLLLQSPEPVILKTGPKKQTYKCDLPGGCSDTTSFGDSVILDTPAFSSIKTSPLSSQHQSTRATVTPVDIPATAEAIASAAEARVSAPPAADINTSQISQGIIRNLTPNAGTIDLAAPVVEAQAPETTPTDIDATLRTVQPNLDTLIDTDAGPVDITTALNAAEAQVSGTAAAEAQAPETTTVNAKTVDLPAVLNTVQTELDTRIEETATANAGPVDIMAALNAAKAQVSGTAAADDTVTAEGSSQPKKQTTTEAPTAIGIEDSTGPVDLTALLVTGDNSTAPLTIEGADNNGSLQKSIEAPVSSAINLPPKSSSMTKAIGQAFPAVREDVIETAATTGPLSQEAITPLPTQITAPLPPEVKKATPAPEENTGAYSGPATSEERRINAPITEPTFIPTAVNRRIFRDLHTIDKVDNPSRDTTSRPRVSA